MPNMQNTAIARLPVNFDPPNNGCAELHIIHCQLARAGIGGEQKKMHACYLPKSFLNANSISHRSHITRSLAGYLHMQRCDIACTPFDWSINLQRLKRMVTILGHRGTAFLDLWPSFWCGINYWCILTTYQSRSKSTIECHCRVYCIRSQARIGLSTWISWWATNTDVSNSWRRAPPTVEPFLTRKYNASAMHSGMTTINPPSGINNHFQFEWNCERDTR